MKEEEENAEGEDEGRGGPENAGRTKWTQESRKRVCREEWVLYLEGGIVDMWTYGLVDCALSL